MDEKFYELSEETLNVFNEVYNAKSFATNIAFQFVGSLKQKQMVKVTKLSDQWRYITNKDMLVSINEDIFDKFDEVSKRILIEQALDKFYIDPNSGNIKTNKPDFITTSGMLNKYGVEKISRALQVEELYNQQRADAQLEESDSFIA